MKVLFITTLPAPYRVDFFNELGKSCELTVLFERCSASHRKESWLNLEFKNFNAVYAKGIKIKNGILPLSLKELSKKYDVIVTNYGTLFGLSSILYMKAKKIPFVINADGGFIPEKENGIKKFIKTKAVMSAAFWLSTSEKTTEFLEYYGAKREKTFIYPFTSLKAADIFNAPASDEEKMSLRRELGVNYKKVVLSAGRIVSWKGFDVVIKAASVLSEKVGVYIVGGEPLPYMKELISELKLKNVHFVPFKSKEELFKYYRMADVFAYASFNEIWGLVINEAFSAGLPVVCSNTAIAGVTMIKNGENGYIFPSKNYEALGEKTAYILSDNELCRKMSENNLKLSEHYTIENMAKRHMEIFEKIKNLK